jgi:hypothetical protein
MRRIIKEKDDLGRRVKDIMSLPKEVIRYIKWVTTT